jgi:hypothetical protein
VLTDVDPLAYELVGAQAEATGISRDRVHRRGLRPLDVQRALDGGGYAPQSATLSIGLGSAGVLLAFATILLVLP